MIGLISYADDFMVSSDGDDADRIWDETTGALGEIRLGDLSVEVLLHEQGDDGMDSQIISLQERDCCSRHGGNGVELDGS